MKRIRILLLSLIMCISSLPLFGSEVSALVAPPILQSPSTSYTYITEDTTPTLIFRAAAGQNIQILKGTQIIGSGSGQGEHPVDIEITVPLTQGLHQLNYRSVESLGSSDLFNFHILVSTSPLDISNIAAASTTLNESSLNALLKRIKPIHSNEQRVDYSRSWFRIVSNIDDLTSTLIVAVYDEYGYPITNLTKEDFSLLIDEVAYTSSLSTATQIAEGVYEFQYAPTSPVGGNAVLYLNGSSLGTVHIEVPAEEEPTIQTILPINHNVVVGQSFTLPVTVEAQMSVGEATYVQVDWGSPVVNTSASGTFVFTGTVANYTGTVTLTLTVTAIDDYRIVLTWGATPSDLDSHLFGSIPAGDFHLYYSNKTYTVGEATYAKIEHDVTTGYGPETTTIYVTDDVGVFRFGVYNFSGTASLATSDAIVTLYKGNDLIGTFTAPTVGSTERYWNVFQIVGGQLISDGPDDALNQLETELNVGFQSAINQAISAIHIIAEDYTIAEVQAVWDIVNNVQTTYSLTTAQMAYYVVNYSELTSIILN